MWEESELGWGKGESSLLAPSHLLSHCGQFASLDVSSSHAHDVLRGLSLWLLHKLPGSPGVGPGYGHKGRSCHNLALAQEDGCSNQPHQKVRQWWQLVLYNCGDCRDPCGAAAVRKQAHVMARGAGEAGQV